MRSTERAGTQTILGTTLTATLLRFVDYRYKILTIREHLIDCYPNQVSLQKNISTTTTEQSNSCSSSDIVWEEKFSTFTEEKNQDNIYKDRADEGIR